MASKSELLQAQAFNRRRLQRAFVSGAPGGRELAPGKPLRGVVVSVALGILTVIVSLLIGTFTGSLPKGWEDGAIIVVQGEGSRYVALDGTLYPVKNLASARLLVGSATITSVPASKLDGILRDPSPVGIDGAPDYLPAPDRQYRGAWLSCVDVDRPLEISTRLLDDPVGAADQGALVKDDDGDYWFIEGDRRYAVGDNAAVVASVFLGIDDIDAVPTVSAPWLNLVTPGSPLEIDLGRDLGEDAGIAGLLVGQAVQTQSDGAVVSEYIADGDGRLVPATPFARQLLTAYVGVEPVVMTVAEATDLADVNSDAIPSDWPETVSAGSGAGRTTCLQMTPGSDGPVVTVATAPDELEAGTQVLPGGGAAITSQSTGQGATYGFVSEAGVYFPVETAEDLALLGYTTDESVTVPAAWTQLLEQGPTLSRALAQRTASGQGG